MIDERKLLPREKPWPTTEPREDRGPQASKPMTVKLTTRFDWSELWEKVWPARWLRK